ncbi:caveolae-associated protein 2b [Gouania willdenowi]|uniref:caveolae-associated protein 2b n=1 Tax=Gouania willdenowi TaxID=441366 RepID=UPI0010550489|nr:caveolae-associated protein 2-like [Gouania willdenowi]
MVTTETHQSQDLLVPHQDQLQEQNPDQNLNLNQEQDLDLASASALLAGLDLDQMSQGPVNAITVLTLLDKLVHMLDTVQENQHKMEVHQVEMEGVVRGIQADMTKLSKSHSHTSNTVSKLLDKSRKLSVTMKEVRDRMERQGAQVRKLEANHAHLISRNNFKVLIFQEENEIPASVFVKDPPPFPRDEILEEAEEPGTNDGNQPQEGGLHTIDLSSDEDVGLEEEMEDEEMWVHDLENMEKSRAEKLKRSSLKKVDSLKKAFSRQNIEKKMTKIGTKIVSAEQREKIKQKTSSLKVSPLTFSLKRNRSSSDSQPIETSVITEEVVLAEPEVQVHPLGEAEEWENLTAAECKIEEEVSFTEVHAQLAPANVEEIPLTEEFTDQVQAELEEELPLADVQTEPVELKEVMDATKEEQILAEEEEEEEEERT